MVTVLVRKKSRNAEAVNHAVTIANRIQPEFKFDVEQVKWLPKGDSEVKSGEVLRTIKENHDGRPIVAVISPRLKGNYFEYASRGLNIVSTADWESRYAPPPLHIYLLFQLAYASASFAANLSPRQLGRGVGHKWVRACIFD